MGPKKDLSAANAAEKQRPRGRPFRPGTSGNPAGKRAGTRHRVTVLAEQLLDGEAEAIVRRAIEKAKAGDMIALRLCLDRIVPVRRDRPVRFVLPELTSVGEAGKAMASIARAVALGELTPAEAAELSHLVEAFVRTTETIDLDRRLRLIEERYARMQGA